MTARSSHLIAAGLVMVALTGCKTFEEPIPGIFYRLSWESPPPDAICWQAAEAIVEVAKFNIDEYSNPSKDWRCNITLNRPAAEGQRPLRITLLAFRSDDALHVGTQEFFLGSVTMPSQSTRALADSIAAHLLERFPASTSAPYQPHYGLFGP